MRIPAMIASSARIIPMPGIEILARKQSDYAVRTAPHP
jgi:hypothetical protein